MPKSKRNRLVSLTATQKKSFSDIKVKLVNDVRQSCDDYSRVFIFSVQNMRNAKLKDVRNQWKDSRFYFGKNKVMTISLGKTKETEYKHNLHKLSDRLYGQCGLLFTNRPKHEVLKWFDEYGDSDYARTGSVATETVTLDAGPLEEFAHSMEPHLRSLGMPTTLQKSVVHLLQDFEVCREGVELTSQQARILKLLGNQMSEFKITLEAIWESDGYYEEFVPLVKPEVTNDKTTVRMKKNKQKRGQKKKTKVEQMSDNEGDDNQEMSDEDNDDDDDMDD
ncbi:mRNA turnover protein 4 homolog [Oppia nitens]|uniref:mRNA turnover protein 4 homolog n=1 Tax=Oppia nitens TaxID=1686743 RepID=UPI0023DC07CE|nr:mRNA turnover protein 4 homolog [Oppia nitens]